MHKILKAMSIQEYKDSVKAEINRLNPNLKKEDWEEIERDLELTAKHKAKDGQIVADPKDEAYLLML